LKKLLELNSQIWTFRNDFLSSLSKKRPSIDTVDRTPTKI
jgi:hypothetical protein